MGYLRRTPVLLLLLILGLPAFAAEPAKERAEQSAAAVKILDAYRNANPQPATRLVHIVYWTPADREPQPKYEERLSRTLRHIRAFYAREMDRNGFGPITFGLDAKDDDASPVRIHLVRGEKPNASYDGDSGSAIRKECVPVLKQAGVDADAETVVIFCNMSNWDAEKRTMSQNSPYYAYGSNRTGTAWQVDSALLDSARLTDREPTITDGQYGRISVGRYNSIFVGGIAHEMGHALGLPHCRERRDQEKLWGTALMGCGNRTYGEDLRDEGKGSFLTFSEAARLASHPAFCGSVKGLGSDANADLRDVTIERAKDGKSFHFSARVTADPPAYVVVGYLDPAGGSDYDATTATAIPDAEGRFTLDCAALTPGRPAVLRVVVGQANGAMTSFNGTTGKFNFAYTVAQDGTADLSAAEAHLRLAPLFESVAKKDAASAHKQLDALRAANTLSPRTLEAAESLLRTLDAPDFGPSPSEATGDRCNLSRAKPAEANVGWGRPTFDRLPDADAPLLIAGSQLFAQGLYAHAPALHAWDLAGKWTKLQGKAAVADGRDGSVRFVVLGDGKELWSTAKVESGKVESFDVSVAGVKRLEFRVEDAGDGNRSDWGVWLEPVVTR